MSPKRLAVRLTAVIPVVLLVACSQQDIEKGVEDAVKSALWFIARMILISLALMMAWAAAALLGAGLIALGVRRRRMDVPTVAAVVIGGALIVDAWPLVFSQSGLAGVLAPGSTSDVTAGPIAAQALAVVAAVIGLIVFLRRRDAKKARGALPRS